MICIHIQHTIYGNNITTETGWHNMGWMHPNNIFMFANFPGLSFFFSCSLAMCARLVLCLLHLWPMWWWPWHCIVHSQDHFNFKNTFIFSSDKHLTNESYRYFTKLKCAILFPHFRLEPISPISLACCCPVVEWKEQKNNTNSSETTMKIYGEFWKYNLKFRFWTDEWKILIYSMLLSCHMHCAGT